MALGQFCDLPKLIHPRKVLGLAVVGGAHRVPDSLLGKEALGATRLWLQLGFFPQAIYKLKKACRVEMESEQQGQLLTPEEVVDRIFLLVDENGDGNGGAEIGDCPLHSTPTFWPCDPGQGPPPASNCHPQL